MPDEPPRAIVFLLDGAADRPCPRLDGLTPLEAAATPVLDRLAREGATGTLTTIPAGCHPGSEVANLSILGYDPRRYDPGRGVLEAASMGIPLADGMVALRANLVSFQGAVITDHSAGHISSEEARLLVEALNAGLGLAGARLHAGVSYRHTLTIENGSPAVSCTPPHDILGREYASYLPRPAHPDAAATCALLLDMMRLSRDMLRAHPVNAARRAAGKPTADGLWPWSPGTRPAIDAFEARHGVRGAVISAVDLVRGIGKLAGMTVITVPGATGLPETNYEGKARAAVDALADHGLVYVHVEGTDEAGHMGDPLLKKKAIEYCDRRLVGHALSLLAARGAAPVRIAVLPDHYTPCETRTHDPTPVPFLIHGPGIGPDTATVFTEASCATGGLGRVEGTGFLPLVLRGP